MTHHKPIQILTVDDHPLVREGIAAILANEADMVLVAEAGDGHEAIEQFRTHRPDITLMDLQMLIMSGTEAIVAIRKEFPDARIIVLTMYSGDAQADRAIKAGAYGYLLKSMVRKELVETIRTVHGGRKGIPPEIAVELAEHHTDDALTEREIEVLHQRAVSLDRRRPYDACGSPPCKLLGLLGGPSIAYQAHHLKFALEQFPTQFGH
jgi:DNA-binding NarL/FixJ family response regulator